VIVETGEKTFDTAALIDPCTQTSSIDASLANVFRLPTTNVGDESICTATIRSKVDEAIKLEVVLKIEPNVRIRTPIRALSESVVKKFRELPLADKRFHRPATISLILGADVYPKVIQPGFHMVQIDGFAKYVYLFYTLKLDTKSCVSALKLSISKFGVSTRIIAVRGIRFTSGRFDECSSPNIKHLIATGASRGNGQ